MTIEQQEEFIQNQLQDLRKELTSAKQKVIQLQQQIKQIEEQIYTNCEHVWKIDRTNVGEHTEYICSKCGGCAPH
jgi:predicted  nucleic acid-binding Zn-ribbon protein